MTKHLSLKSISSANLKNGYLFQFFPELKKLKDNYELNSWHDETTFDHTIKVIKKFESWHNRQKRNTLYKHFNNKIDTHKKIDLFKLALFLHDIGKTKTITINSDNTSSFPEHEKASYNMSPSLLKKFDLSLPEKRYILFLIRYHYLPHQSFTDLETETNKNFLRLKEKYPKLFIELIVFGLVDTQGSKLNKKNPSEFKKRMKKYTQLLKDIKTAS